MKILAITQARVGSSRLPGKVLNKVGKKTLLEIHLERILKSQSITKIKIATTTEPDAYKIEKVGNKVGIESYKGSIENVLERFYNTAKTENPDWVVRLTSDCPLIDPEVIDSVIQFAIEKDLDYASNTLVPTMPDGMDVEVFKFPALEKAYNEARSKSEQEHVTPYIWKNSTYKGNNLFRSDNFDHDRDYSSERLTIDTPEDFEAIKKLIEVAGTEKSWLEYVTVLDKHPEIRKINAKYERNEGYDKSLNNEKNGE